MAFKYGGTARKAEDVVRASKSSGDLYDRYLNPDVQRFKPKAGENCLRICPPSWGDGRDWALPVYVHYGIGPDNATYLCEAKMKPGSKCVVCEARKKATDEDEADALRITYRPHCFVVDRDAEKTGPQVWDVAGTLFKEINARSVDRKTGEVVLIDDPVNGYDIMFDREGTNMRTKYINVGLEREPTPLSDDERNFWAEKDKNGEWEFGGRWIEYLEDHPLPELLIFHPQDHIESVLYARPVRKEDEEERPSRSRRDAAEEEEKPSRRRRDTAEEEERPSRRRRDAEEEEKPSRRSRDTEEEEKPSRRSRDTAEEDDPPSERRRRSSADEEESRPSRRRDADAEEEERPARRRGADAEEERPARRRLSENGKGNGADEEDPDFKPRSRRGGDDDEPAEDATVAAKAELDELRGRRRRAD